MPSASIKKPLPYAWKHSRLAYSEPKRSSDNSLLHGCEIITMENQIDFAYAAIYDTHVVLSFRGTEGLKAWISDFDPYPLREDEFQSKVLVDSSDWGKGIIHDGLYTAWKFFKPCIDKLLTSHDIDNKIIITCGHSRGGAFAELCSRHLAKNKKVKSSCFTFGAPAVGTKIYRDEFRLLQINGTRVVNGWDIVPTLPPKSFGFRHGCAKLIWNKKAWWKKYIPHIRAMDHLSRNYEKYVMKKFG